VLAVAGGLLMLSVVSGTLGLGVVFATVPFLGLFMSNLVDQVQPLSLLLNGITALFAAFGFARSHLIDARRALGLAVVTTAFAPLGALLAHVRPRRDLVGVPGMCASWTPPARCAGSPGEAWCRGRSM
jgi:uncharacterized protein